MADYLTGNQAAELLSMIREMTDALGWYTSFSNDVQNTTPEYFELCGDLNAVMYLQGEAQAIRDRALTLLHEWEAPEVEVEPDYEDIPL